MIKSKNICKEYKTKYYDIVANDNVSIDIAYGEIVWVSGVSGAGKSTLLHILSSIDTPTSGSVYWGEKEVSTMSDTERSHFRLNNIGLILQSLELLKTQSVFDNIALPLRFMKYETKKINAKVLDILEDLHISDLKTKKPDQLSGGQKQRVAIARALVTEVPYILGDEITANLDENTAKFIYDYVKNTIKKRNGIGFFISHDTSIKDYVDTMYTMKDGILEATKWIYLN